MEKSDGKEEDNEGEEKKKMHVIRRIYPYNIIINNCKEFTPVFVMLFQLLLC